MTQVDTCGVQTSGGVSETIWFVNETRRVGRGRQPQVKSPTPQRQHSRPCRSKGYCSLAQTPSKTLSHTIILSPFSLPHSPSLCYYILYFYTIPLYSDKIHSHEFQTNVGKQSSLPLLQKLISQKWSFIQFFLIAGAKNDQTKSVFSRDE